ncbi:MAG: NAD-dependent epimerase/dehydratase family protein [Deltaproteobacteria bacterium]|nr:NAD-dependent epimerase/dehydratase family protein [Deltaproteobacteria bacterium]
MSSGKTLVTGASGFIGSAVVRKLLARGREVRCYVEPGADRRNLSGLDVEVIEGDVNDRQRIADALRGCEVLYHLAAIYKLWMPDDAPIYEVNVEGTKTVLWAAYKASLRKVVYTSSIAAIGDPGNGGPADETVKFNLWKQSNAYIRSKWLSERDALRFAAEGLPLTVVNPSFPFGERDVGPTPTGKLILQALQGKVTPYMEGGCNCVDVEDVAEAHVLAEERGKVGERYIAGGHNVRYDEFFDLVMGIGGVNHRRVKVPKAVFHSLAWLLEKHADYVSHTAPPMTLKSSRWGARNVWYDCTKARRDLGMPLTPLRDTVAKSIRWFRENGYA